MRSVCVALLILICIPLSANAEEGDMLSEVSRGFCNSLVAADAGKIKKLGVLAIVKPSFTIDGKLQKGFTPLFFVQIGRHWKVTIKK